MATRTWNGSTAAFTTAADWSGGVTPGFGDTAIIPSGVVQLTGASNGVAFMLGDATGMGLLPTLAVTNATFGSSTSISDLPNGNAFQVTVNGTLTNSGAIFVTHFGSDGLINNAAGTSGTFTQAAGSITISNGGELDINTATVQLNAGATVSNGLLVVNNFNPNQTPVALSGTGSVALAANATFEDLAQTTTGIQVQFGDNTNDTFVIGGTFGGSVTGFDVNNVIDLATVPSATNASYANGTITVTNNGVVVDTITASGPSLSTNTMFQLVADGSGGEDLSIACFAAGTLIRTPSGEVAVEQLCEGDLVATREGSAPVRWLGHRRVSLRSFGRPEDVMPVRIESGAFEPGVPVRPLLLSPEHAVFAMGALIPVGLLVNGRTVRREWRNTVDYYHVELPEHAVIFADGLATESWLDDGNRATFDNAAANQPALSATPVACAPLHESGVIVEAVRHRLASRAATLGFGRPPASERMLLAG